MGAAADRAWVDGRLFTGRRWVEALLAEGSRIVVAGTAREVRRAAPTGTVVHRLRGRLAVPGFVDPHAHWLEMTLARVGVDLGSARGPHAVAARLARAATDGGRGPVLGFGWDEGRLAGGRPPTRRLLDRAVPSRPVVAYRVCHHVAVANSAALAAAGVDAATPDPPDGRFGRDADGALDGRLYDGALRAVRPLGVARFRADPAAARAALADAAACGVTTLGAMSAGPDEIAQADALAARGLLPLRLAFYLAAEHRARYRTLARRRGGGGRVVGLKLHLDGSLGARTAWLAAPYSDRRGTRGGPLATPRAVAELLDFARDAGAATSLHAIGDAALGTALAAVARAGPAGPVRIEHAAIVPPPLLRRLVRPGLHVVVQPRFRRSDTWIGARLGARRSRWAYPFRRLLDAGAAVAASSDAPIEPVDPWTGVDVLARDVGLPLLEAVRLYTVAAGRALGDPALGTLEAGAPADVVVLGTADLERVRGPTSPVAATWAAGRRVPRRRGREGAI